MAAIVFAGVQWFDLYHEPAALAKPGPRSFDQITDLGETPELRRIQKAVDEYFGKRKADRDRLFHLRFDPDEGPFLDVVCGGFEIVGQL